MFAFGARCLATVSFTASSVPNGIVNDSYLGTIYVSGGCTPYRWQVASGALPSGVTMKVSTGGTFVVLTGTPTKSASYSFSMAATSCKGNVAKASYKVVVQSKPDHVVDLTWIPSTSTDVAGYNVYRGPDGKSWSRINVSLAASALYTDSTVADSSTYYYAATAVDIYGNESKKSNIAKSRIP